MPGPSFGMRIVHAGNNSIPGHMYIVLNDGNGNVSTYGHYPNTSFPGGVLGGPGEVRKDYDKREHEDITSSPSERKGSPDIRYDVPLSISEFEAVKRFAENAVTQAGRPGTEWGTYSPTRNSCIDFTWRAMQEAGLNPAGKEGALLPRSNIPQEHHLAPTLNPTTPPPISIPTTSRPPPSSHDFHAAPQQLRAPSPAPQPRAPLSAPSNFTPHVRRTWSKPREPSGFQHWLLSHLSFALKFVCLL